MPSATHLLVTFRADGVDRIAIVEKDRAGIELDEWWGISNQNHAAVTFTGVTVDSGDVLGTDGDAAAWSATRRPTTADRSAGTPVPPTARRHHPVGRRGCDACGARSLTRSAPRCRRLRIGPGRRCRDGGVAETDAGGVRVPRMEVRSRSHGNPA